MPSKNGKHLVVAPEFERVLRRGHRKINDFLCKKISKKITFIDYTAFLSESLGRDFDRIVSIRSVKRGRRTVKIESQDLKKSGYNLK